MKINRGLPIVILICIGLAFATADAQENLAQEAYAILQRNCLICHGEHGPYTEQLVIQSSQALINTGTVIPGNPGDSEFYQRLIETAVERRMPLGQPPLSPEAIEMIRQWIQAGAPDWNTFSRPDTNFITPDEMLQTIENHVQSLDTFDRAFARYFTSTHLYNAGETIETLRAYRRALSKLVNSLSWGREVTNPQPIDAEETIFYIDLRDYEWEVGTNRWTQIEQAYRYKNNFESATQTHLHEKLTNLRQETNCEVPFVHIDWFLANASLPPLYHDILDLPLTDRELEAELDVNVVENIRNAAGRRVWRAGFNNSGVSNNNRVVERHISRYGAYWKSYDFAGSVGNQNIFTHPLSFAHDGGEIVFNLPNGLQAYYLADAGGNRLDEAPISIVSNPAASDPTVRNGLSCIGCHTEGMKSFEDEVRAVIEQNENPPFDKAQALRLYVDKTEMEALVEEDTDRYRQALEEAGGVFGGIEPIQRFHEAFQGPVDAAHAAAAVGLETEVFLEKIGENVSLQNLGLLVLANGTVKRDTWTEQFSEVVFALDFPEESVAPSDPQPERIPGASVYIPDPNLRTAFAQILAQPVDAPITVGQMESFTYFGVHGSHITTTGHTPNVLRGKGIKDLTGLEYAKNLKELVFEDNEVSDLSPLANLIALEELRFSHNNISDLSPIAGLTKMRVLNMEHNPISNLSPLAGMSELESIQFSHNFLVTEISVLAGKEKLKSVLMWGPPIRDMSPLAELPNIETIDLCGNKISEIPSLENAPNLKKLYLVSNQISDVSVLQNLKGLESLNLSGNNITDISPLTGLTRLKWLRLNENNISDVSALAGLINLEHLDLRGNPITDFSPLEALSQNTNILTGEVAIPDRNLRAAIAEALGKENTVIVSITAEEMATLTDLDAENLDIQDLQGLQFATNLEHLNIQRNPISDLSPLGNLTKLKELRFWTSTVSDISPLAGLQNLEGLSAWDANVLDLSPLKELPKLRWLEFSNAPLSDLSPLRFIPSLRRLVFYVCDISDLSPLGDLTGLKDIQFSHNKISDISPLAGLTGLEVISIKDNEISDISSLAGLSNLRELRIGENKILDVSPLASLHKLEFLEIEYNSISDFSPLDGLRQNATIVWHANPGFPKGGPKIEGPWLWVTVPGEGEHHRELSRNRDLLAEASDGAVTEQQIATDGATVGGTVGNSVWTAGEIDASDGDNIVHMLHELGMESPEFPNYVLYGSITLYSPHQQDTTMYVGGDDDEKVWLNGELIYHSPHRYLHSDYETFFPVTLKQGRNVLLVATYNDGGAWSAFFGFEEGTEYILGGGFTFSATATSVIPGDTLTLNLNAENITDLAGWQADITFDPNILEAVEVTEGDFLKAEGGDTFFQGGTIDNGTGKITSLFSARISESGVSGTGILMSVTFKAKAGGETQVTLENFEFSSITGDIIPSVPPNITIIVGNYPAWDVNQDGRVSIVDLVLVAKDLGSDTPANLRTDVNRDGTINIQDLILVAQHLGESTTSAAPSAIAIDGLELDPAMIQAWIAQAQVEDDGSIAFQQGIANLERLLTLFIPEETALLHNYPNPFNPETWIPYQLAEPAEVTLTIHAVNGTLIRTLALGHQPAGIYQTRNRAIYWDGKNEVGESVASSIYFYTLTAGDFNATRKMLIRK